MPIPSLNPSPRARASIPPPAHFQALRGPIERVSWKPSGAASGGGLTLAQRAGLRYEAKAQLYLRQQIPDYIEAPVLTLLAGGNVRRVIPDGMLLRGELAYVFEIKSQHTHAAWWQLRRLYEPVVRELGGIEDVICVEVVRSYDPSIGFPEDIDLCRSIEEVLEPSAGMKVLLWRA